MRRRPPAGGAARARGGGGRAGAAAGRQHAVRGGAGERRGGGGAAVPPAGRQAARQHGRARARHHPRHRGDRHRLRLGGRAHAPAGAGGMARARGGAARGAAVHQLVCLGFAQSGAAGFLGRAAGGERRLLSARLPAGRRGAARDGPGAGGERAPARPRAVALLLRRRAAPASPRAARRHAAGGAAHAGRVRCLHAAALPHLHHGTLRRVPHRLRWPGRVAAGGGAAGAVPDLRGGGDAGAGGIALRAARPRRAAAREPVRARRRDPAGARRVRGAGGGDAGRAAGDDRLLADAARRGGDHAGQRLARPHGRCDARLGLAQRRGGWLHRAARPPARPFSPRAIRAGRARF